MNYTFEDRLAFSRGQRERSDIDTLLKMIPGCVSVEKTDTETDKAGIDYIATLRRGAEIFIDAKARSPNSSKYWKGEPEVALEIYSVIDTVAGWTLNESKSTDFVLFTFDPGDTTECFLISFQLLRAAFVKNFKKWTSEYKIGIQDSGTWKSKCVFVPISVVERAIQQVSRGTLVI